jgi:DeoR family suf operon transcriptional repressor
MMESFRGRQKDLLTLLLKKEQGLAVEDLSSGLGISRPAARQRVTSLIRLGYVERGDLVNSGGRPTQTYRLTPKGYQLFPKQYTWFSEVLLENLKLQLGSSGLRNLMSTMGKEVAAQTAPSLQGASLKVKVQKVAEIMSDLAYQAETVFTGKEKAGEAPAIEANNCVFHSLAEKFPEICQFDLALLSELTDATVMHEKCILHGSETCRFRFVEKK